jgi:hypothetical protein
MHIVQQVEHEVIERHCVPRCADGFRFAMLAVKGGFDHHSRLCALTIPSSNAARRVLNDSAAFVAPYLWSCMTFVVYLEDERHFHKLRQIARSATLRSSKRAEASDIR